MLNSSPSFPGSGPLSKHSIIIIHAGAIGDLLLTRPALRALRHSYPQSQVVACGYPERLQLLQDDCHLNSLIYLDNLPLAPLFQNNPIPEKAPFNYLSQFDLIVSWFGSSSQEFKDNINKIGSKSKIILAASRPPGDWSIHASKYYLETLQPLGIKEIENDSADLVVGETGSSLDFTSKENIVPLGRGDFSRPWEAKSSTTQKFDILEKVFSKKLVAIHPGSGGAFKNWPFDHFALLAQGLQQELKAGILLLCGPADQRSCQQFLLAFKGEPLVMIDSPPLSSLPCILQKCTLFIGNDSGITHLAAALGIPTVAIFGPTDPTIWKPLGKKVVVIKNTHMNNMSSAQSLNDKHDVTPHQSHTQVNGINGSTYISVEQVLDAIKTMM